MTALPRVTTPEPLPIVSDQPASRRSVLTQSLSATAGTLTAFWGAAFWGAADAQAAPPTPPAEVDPSSLLNKLVRRVTYAETPFELDLARTMGFQGYLDHHLEHLTIDDLAVESRMGDYDTLSMTYQQMLGVTGGQVQNECIEAAIIRAALSHRQLFERMVEFWTDHFNIDMNQSQRLRPLKAIDDRDVIRTHALGNFGALLSASAHSPAMLDYLDNNLSTAGNPNENYARELMELHTLGADGGYTQTDVIEVARCFTGWQFFPDNAGEQAGTFRYNQNVHDTGSKVVLGVTIPARNAALGIQDGQDVLNILLSHPGTAQYVSAKLCRWLLGDVPQGVVDVVAAAFTTTNGDIKSMIRAALMPDHLAMAALKFKRPWHQFIGCLRMGQTTITSTTSMRSRLLAAGMPRFGWATPDGYPDNTAFWAGLILPRWNFAADLMNSAIGGISHNAPAFFAGLTTADQMADRINADGFGGELPTDQRDRLRDYLLPNVPSSTRQREALGLAMSAPFFQWY